MALRASSITAGRVDGLRVALTRLGLVGFLAFGALCLGASMATSLFPITLCLAFAGLLAAFTFFDTGPALLVALAIGLFLGVIRRMFEYGLDTAGAVVDPLFLIPPAVTIALLAVAARRGALRDRTPLSSVVLGICALGVVGAINPLQGGLLAAAIGLVVFMTPVLWFWIGRALVDDHRMGQIFTLAAIAAVASAAYGLAQTSGRFFSWDQAWIDSSQAYASLRVSTFVRGFGFSSSGAEYGKVLAIGVVVIAASLIGQRRAWWLPLMGLLGPALFLSGLRTTLVLSVVGVGLIWGARRGASIVQLAVYGAIAIVFLLLLAAQVTPDSSGPGSPTGEDATTVLADRQVTGLTDPFNSRSSTLQSHVGLVTRAFGGLKTAPIGQGTATITIAGKRFGSSAAGDTDIADAAIAFGVFGVALYVALCVRLFRRAHFLAVRRGDVLSLAALGVVVVSSLQWLNGGLYAANFLAWLTFGWIDRATSRLEEDTEAERETAASAGALTL